MATTTRRQARPADLRQQVIEFAATYPTRNVREAVRLAEAGTLRWEDVYDLFQRAAAEGIAAVADEVPPRAGLIRCPNGCGRWVENVYIDPTMPCP
jgi:hypothetical protein